MVRQSMDGRVEVGMDVEWMDGRIGNCIYLPALNKHCVNPLRPQVLLLAFLNAGC